MSFWIDELKFDENGLIPAIVQDVDSKQVLMMAYMNQEALEKTISTGMTCFYSRSRQELWQKGETSGNTQSVVEIRHDCDSDTLLVFVKAAGPACHTGHETCFYRNIEGEELSEPKFDPDAVYGLEGPAILYELIKILQDRREHRPQGSYSAYLFNEGIDKILKKVGEETAEVIIAAKNTDPGELVYEASDLVYHLLVLLVEKGIDLGQVFSELRRRR
ncbi:MAG: bifunctional phosphoribosyl-AMP cyclohydrolase/phosphoribosyl-ATP diphosphatase HisIE [Candidatus Saccharibacteria bacterium]